MLISSIFRWAPVDSSASSILKCPHRHLPHLDEPTVKVGETTLVLFLCVTVNRQFYLIGFRHGCLGIFFEKLTYLIRWLEIFLKISFLIVWRINEMRELCIFKLVTKFWTPRDTRRQTTLLWNETFDPKQTACSIYNFMIFFPRFFRFIFLFFVLVESIKVRIFLNIL
jgi:hypothetical protein